ncbi:MAG TPA: NADH-quinone oxidoreductase subunit L [Syntrophales bacterium]|nr:NADH-quinone oxidoreductase subunit L [Syntrophales bacterium]
MLEFILLICAFPFAGFVILILAGSRLSRRGISTVGAGSVGLAAITAILTGINFVISPPPGDAYTQTLWTWLAVGGFSPLVSLYLDALSVVMVLVVAIVGFFILLYSAEHMAREAGMKRFFSYMDLFVGSMLVLVMADNLLLLYLGWEGVGLCSYLLIGFWYDDPVNIKAANKAFIVTRIGDTAFAVGLLLLFVHLNTLSMQGILQAAPWQWTEGSNIAFWAALLLLGGAVGKSAQLPLQTWLPDAMAGPTPVSALIHAATMVTAGVYLIARMHVIFQLAPLVQGFVAVIGAATLLLAAGSAIAQWDIKRILAYSTISQIGYMFLALGVGAWSAAIFHFMTHAFFKALLFLGAGVVITGLGGEHDIYKMGGLRGEMPVTFWTFLIGAASLAALPFITAGFYSKDMILFAAWASERGSPCLWAAGCVGAFLTGLYAFRLVFLVFFGKTVTPVDDRPGPAIIIPLVALAGLSLVSGFVQMPAVIAPVAVFSDFMSRSLPGMRMLPVSFKVDLFLLLAAALISLIGIFTAWWLYIGGSHLVTDFTGKPVGALIHRLSLAGWGFDFFYDALFVRPFVWAARVNKGDFVDVFYRGAAWFSSRLSLSLARTQSGMVRQYALGVAMGAVIAVGLILVL